MRKRALLSALALSFLAAGCDSQKTAEPPKPTTAAVVPLPPAAPTAPAASANQDAPAQVAQTAPAGKAGAPAKDNGRRGCTQNKCTVTIEVNEGATPCAKATPDKLNVYAGNKGDHIHWKIRTKDWKFVTTGIEWKDSGASQQFSGGGHDSGGSNTFKWKDANTDDAEYRYTIHLVNAKDDKKKCDVDPSAVNGASSPES